MCLDTQELGYEGEQKNREGTETLSYGYVEKKSLRRWEILEYIYMMMGMIK